MSKRRFVYRHSSPLVSERICRMCKNPFKLVPKNRLESICGKCKKAKKSFWMRPGIAI